MRPLVHPSIEDITVEGILHALADPVRVAIFANIASSGCSQNCSAFVEVNEQTIPKSTLSQHFRALREAGLIRSERHGVELQNTSRCAEIEARFKGLIAAIIHAHTVQSRQEDHAVGTVKRKFVKRPANPKRFQRSQKNDLGGK